MKGSLVFPCLLLAQLALSACHKEPDFDARYDETQNKIEARAAEMDKDLKAPNDVDKTADQ